MVGHEAIRENFHAVSFGIVLQPRQVGAAIFIGKEHVVPTIAPLSDMVGHVGTDSSSKAGHMYILTGSAVRKKGSVPFVAPFVAFVCGH